jgi:CubicO group peptidase (beta-lactamase class C family)
MRNRLLFTFFLFIIFSCSDKVKDEKALYFPPVGSATWESVSAETLGWKTEPLQDLLSLLESNGTRAFIVLKNGKIVIEEYFGNTLAGTSLFKQDSYWYWASAGKTLTAFTVGKAVEEGKLTLSDKTSDYLGTGWTSLTSQKEDLITVWHQLTMTSGLDDGVTDNHSFAPADLKYKADAGTRWAYHNAPYTLLESVVSEATGTDFDLYFNEVLRDKIGMNGMWNWSGNDHVYYSDARSMARFGLLILAEGKWNGVAVINNPDYFSSMINSSQTINKSYGYLWWLNGKDSYMVPESQIVFPGSFSPNAPDDMVSGMGKYGQYVCVIPSEGMVVVRMGENPESVPVPFLFLDDIWNKLKLVIN